MSGRRELEMESDRLLGGGAGSKKILLSVAVAFIAIVVGISISAIVLSVRALHEKKITDKVEGCYYTSTSNDYVVPSHNPGYTQVATLIRGGTVWTGTGQLYQNYDILIVNGKITRIGPSPLVNVTEEVTIYNVNGAFVTPGLVDMHSHAGVYSLPEDAHATQDGNELSNPTTPQVRTIDAIDPNDPAIPLILSGGVTTSLILPGSGNLIGGEAYHVKMKGGSVANMSIPGAPRAFKMAAGENPKNVYGAKGVMPSSRMAWGFRKIFSEATDLKLQQDQWDCIQKTGTAQQAKRPYDAQLEPLIAILRGEALVNVHCYEVQDFETILRVADEFGFKVAAFHHALEAYMIPYVFGPRNITIATFSDLWGFKMEAYDASVNSPSILAHNGVNVALKSDHPVLFAKFLIYEAVKANHYGLGIDNSLRAVTAIPANAIGLGDRIGTLEVGKDGDVVVWDKHPLVLGAEPTQVFIEGILHVNNPLPDGVTPSVTPPTNYSSILTTNPANACSASTGNYYVTAPQMYPMTDDNVVNTAAVLVENGIISCVGTTTQCPLPATGSYNQYSLDSGFIIPGVISTASTVGMQEIDQEDLSGDGYVNEDNSATVFGADGFRLEGKKVRAAWAGGVTVQIAKPESSSLISGTSAAFYTHGTIANDALLVEKLALHLTIGNPAKNSAQSGSVSGQFSLLRSIFRASNTSADPLDPVFLAINGTIPIIVSVDQADEIGSLLRFVRDFNLKNVAVLGGAEASIIAPQLQAAGVSVVLSNVQGNPHTFETQRATEASPGILVNAGVRLGVAETEPGIIRNLRWSAGYALSNGVTSYAQALATVTRNVAAIFNLPAGTGTITVGTKANFVVFNGDPLATGSKVAAVALGDFVECNPQQL